MAKRIRNYSGIIARVLFKNNYLEFTRFSCSITVKFIRNNASNIASKNCAKRLRYSNRAVMHYNQRSCFDCFISVSRSSCINSFMPSSGNYSSRRWPLGFFHPVMVGHFCCNVQPLPKAFLWCRYFLLQFIFFYEFTYRPTSKNNHHTITRVLKKLQ